MPNGACGFSDIGSTIALTPVFFALLVTVPWGRPLTSLPAWIWITCPALMCVFPVTLAYVIVVQRAMDFRMVVRHGLPYALATRALRVVQAVAVVLVAIGVLYMVNEPGVRRPQRIQYLALGVAFALWSRVVAAKLRTWIDKRFFREAVDAERVLSELSEQVRTIVETKSLLQKVTETIASAMHVSQVAALLPQSGSLQPAYALGFGGNLPLVSLGSDGATVANLKKSGEALRYYADDPQSWARLDPAMEGERQKLEMLGSQLLLPLRRCARIRT